MSCTWLLLGLPVASGCHAQESTPTVEAPKAAPSAAPASAVAEHLVILNRLARLDFNRRAVELNLPLFWRSDANNDGVLDPNELAVTWSHTPHARTDYVTTTQTFTPEFLAIYERMQSTAAVSGPELEQKRRAAVALELSQGRPTLVANDFSTSSAADKALVAHVMRVAVLIERIYGKQKGTSAWATKLVPDDTASAALFFRNQGPFCVAPKTERDENCSALPERPRPIFGLYPAAIQSDKKFCEALGKQKNAKELLDHFSVVADGATANTFKAVKYSMAYADEMSAIAKELDAAAADASADEGALKQYLSAAAQSFRDDDWEPANRAWVAMNANNSKYYLRVGPDEVYFEPCSWKAGFALAFARINPDSLAWQKRLEPIKQDMENDLARLAGSPYHARQVAFKLPDFIDIVLNAGDSRMPIGGTIGQSLPNWGPVAEKGGRTVTMTNLNTDVDSQKALSEQMSSLLCKTTMAQASIDPKAAIMGIVLHEATHNLGPAADYRVNGKNDVVTFGGPLAATFEELKAETGALYFPAELAARKLISEREAQIADLTNVSWGLGHIADGMYDAQGKPKNYSQLAAIQIGSLEAAGALEWKPNEPAANGNDTGCIEIHFDKWNTGVTDLARQVLQIKSKGDRAGAELLKKKWVDDDGAFKQFRETVAQRWLRTPKSTFVYAL